MAVTSPGRQAEGYAKEIFGGTDATTLATGITEVGTAQVPGNASGGGNTIVELFAAMLTELRQQTALLEALREPLGVDIKLRNVA